MSTTNLNHTILLVDDEQDILDFLSYNLKKEGYRVFTANNGSEGVRLAKEISPSLVILDIMMPEMDGIEACQTIRNDAQLTQPLIVFLTSRSEDYSQIAGFEAGADDYINKPIRPRLLLSKVESLLRRYKTNESTFKESAIRIDREQYIVHSSNGPIILPKKEFELLELLVSKPGKVYTRDQIMNNVWGDLSIVGERTIDVHIRKLREKLGNHYIRTIKGVGYTYQELWET